MESPNQKYDNRIISDEQYTNFCYSSGTIIIAATTAVSTISDNVKFRMFSLFAFHQMFRRWFYNFPDIGDLL